MPNISLEAQRRFELLIQNIYSIFSCTSIRQDRILKLQLLDYSYMYIPDNQHNHYRLKRKL